MRAVWLTDIHLNFLDEAGILRLMAQINDHAPGAILIGGDIGDALRLPGYLPLIDRTVSCPVYFVMGNHDYYHSGISGVRDMVRTLCADSQRLVYLPDAGIVPLGEGVALVGVDGWGDGRYGAYGQTRVLLNDFLLIEDLQGLTRAERLTRLMALGDAEAARVCAHLPGAFAQHRRVVFLTHVPPFREACWHNGRISNDDFLPFFTCKAVGDALLSVMDAQPPDRELLVLCGHTHGEGYTRIRQNVLALTGGAIYGAPAVQRVFAW